MPLSSRISYDISAESLGMGPENQARFVSVAQERMMRQEAQREATEAAGGVGKGRCVDGIVSILALVIHGDR